MNMHSTELFFHEVLRDSYGQVRSPVRSCVLGLCTYNLDIQNRGKWAAKQSLQFTVIFTSAIENYLLYYLQNSSGELRSPFKGILKSIFPSNKIGYDYLLVTKRSDIKSFMFPRHKSPTIWSVYDPYGYCNGS